jgi:hypothetical protein
MQRQKYWQIGAHFLMRTVVIAGQHSITMIAKNRIFFLS